MFPWGMGRHGWYVCAADPSGITAVPRCVLSDTMARTQRHPAQKTEEGEDKRLYAASRGREEPEMNEEKKIEKKQKSS